MVDVNDVACGPGPLENRLAAVVSVGWIGHDCVFAVEYKAVPAGIAWSCKQIRITRARLAVRRKWRRRRWWSCAES